MKLHALVLVALVLACTMSGCTSGKRPFLMVEICLSKTADLSAFTSEMRSISHSEGLALIDNGANTQKDLEWINNPNVNKAMHGPIINMGIERDDGVGLMVANLGLPANQLVMGFSEGSNPSDAHKFADRVLTRLKQRWRMEAVPPGNGAMGMKDCN